MSDEKNNKQDTDKEEKIEQTNIDDSKKTVEEKKEVISETEMGEEILKWSFPEFVEYDRSRNWYFIAISLVVIAVIYSIVIANFLFAIFLIIFTGIVLFQIRSAPKKVEFKVFEKGILMGETFYNWVDIKSFSIIKKEPQRVYFDLSNSILPDLSIPLKSQDLSRLHEVLGNYLKENENKKDENLVDKLSKWLKI